LHRAFQVCVVRQAKDKTGIIKLLQSGYYINISCCYNC